VRWAARSQSERGHPTLRARAFAAHRANSRARSVRNGKRTLNWMPKSTSQAYEQDEERDRDQIERLRPLQDRVAAVTASPTIRLKKTAATIFHERSASHNIISAPSSEVSVSRSAPLAE